MDASRLMTSAPKIVSWGFEKIRSGMRTPLCK
jgi:hypothetical protein